MDRVINVRLNAYRSFGRVTLVLVALLGGLSGCALLPSANTGSGTVVEPQLPPDPERPPAPVVEPSASTDDSQPPAPPEEGSSPGVDERLRLAVLLSDRTVAFEGVANELAAQLDAIDIYDLTDKSITPREIFDTIRAADTDVVVAVGMRATSFAQTFEDLPVVFAQVFNVAEIDTSPDNVKGVSVIPPLDLQLQAWLEVNPNLSSVGAIVGDGHEPLIAEATQAAEANGVRFQHAVAQSDRETLYMFTRLVPDIDGFLLFPDNRVLSASILRQMLAYASRHRVQVAVFNDALLPLGATISVTSVEEDIARTVLEVARKMHAGNEAEIPDLTPLRKIRVRTPAGAVEQVAGDFRDAAETSR